MTVSAAAPAFAARRPDSGMRPDSGAHHISAWRISRPASTP